MRLTRAVEIGTVGLVMAFATLRAMELINIATSGNDVTLLILHAVCIVGAASLVRGHRRILLLSVFYGTARFRMDVALWEPPADLQLNTEIVVITGASSGIGLALAHELAARKATLFLGCRDVDKCQRVKPQGAHVSCLKLDLADLDSVAAFARQLRARVDRVDALVLNAGMLMDYGARTAQGFEESFGVIHLAHFLLTRELWSLLQRPHPSSDKPARVISHASAAYMTANFASLLQGDGEADLRGEVVDGCVRYGNWDAASLLDFARAAGNSLANLYTDGWVRLHERRPALCPIAGSYSRAKLAQVLFSQELQAQADRSYAEGTAKDGLRRVLSSSAHPGTVRSGIVWLPGWLVRPTQAGARVLLYCLLGGYDGGSFIDEMQRPHELLSGRGQAGRPQGSLFSVPIASYERVTQGRAAEYRTKLWALSERLVRGHASAGQGWTSDSR